ncbi:MAG: YggS family pyridoxal phosphate-dependent enzyme [Ketobacteraceae bacterium]|nr:YggS family pyridoxal phosphate-dependent enzyme [Ketobacteraceae bacterium]
MSEAEVRLKTIRQQLEEAAGKHGRPVPQLLAVSKKHSTEAIADLFNAGQQAFGESYLQEALTKQAALGSLAIEWHFIGPVQSNKTRDIANHFSWVHSVDRLKIARRLSDQLAPGRPPLNICVQVNIDSEPSKSGIAPEDLGDFCQTVSQLPGLSLRGLMCIPEKRSGLAAQREPFARLRQLQEQLRQQGFTSLDTLSMGMSDDFEAAIAEGSTLVRIGTALFGPRET